MRRRAWAAWGAFLLGVALMSAGNAAGTEALRLPGGVLVAAGLVLAATLPAFWRRALPPLPPMPDLAQRPRPGQRWCAGCGRPAPRDGPCASCGGTSRRMRRNQRRLQRKQRAMRQERKT